MGSIVVIVSVLFLFNMILWYWRAPKWRLKNRRWVREDGLQLSVEMGIWLCFPNGDTVLTHSPLDHYVNFDNAKRFANRYYPRGSTSSNDNPKGLKFNKELMHG